MKHRTTAALVRGILLVVAGTAPATFTTPVPGVPPSTQALHAGVHTTGHDQPASRQHIQLVVGDRLPLALTSNRAGTMRIELTHDAEVNSRATFVTSDDRVVRIQNRNVLVAGRAGRTTVTARPRAGSSDSTTFTVEVITRRLAINRMIVEVCPNRDERALVASGPFIGDVSMIHEYHDCQKLISRGRYVTVAGIFSPHTLAFAQSRDSFATGRLVAMMVNFGTRRDTATYRPLGLRPGTNCLYLRAIGPAGWEAYVVGQPTAFISSGGAREYGNCDPAMSWPAVEAGGRQLRVLSYSGVDMKGDSVAPAVARWDWDSTNAQNYIGVKCGRATWCEIGPDRFVRRRPLMYTDPNTRTVRPILKGYYDEQYLADSAGTRPTRVFGTITPGLDTRAHDTMKHGVSRNYHVAQLTFRNDSVGQYYEYDRYVRAYTDARPTDPSRTSTAHDLFPTGDPLGQNKRGVYSGRLGNKPLPADAIMYRYHVPHGGTPTPTARWRWVENDEKTWSYCDPHGCCEIQNTFTM